MAITPKSNSEEDNQVRDEGEDVDKLKVFTGYYGLPEEESIQDGPKVYK